MNSFHQAEGLLDPHLEGANLNMEDPQILNPSPLGNNIETEPIIPEGNPNLRQMYNSEILLDVLQGQQVLMQRLIGNQNFD
jgi:hypothetical protein